MFCTFFLFIYFGCIQLPAPVLTLVLLYLCVHICSESSIVFTSMQCLCMYLFFKDLALYRFSVLQY